MNKPEERKELTLQEKIDDRVERAFAMVGITQERMKNHWFGNWLRKWFWLVEHWFKVGYSFMFISFIVIGVFNHVTYQNLLAEAHKGCVFACKDEGSFNETMLGLYMNDTDVICRCGIRNGINTALTREIRPSGEPASVPIELKIKEVSDWYER